AEDAASRSDGPSVWGEDGFTFGDVLDMVNPLQHLPIVSMIYRGITGDEIAQGPRIIGGMLFGGPSGAVFAAIDSSIEAETGYGFGAHLANAATGGRLFDVEGEQPPINPDPARPGAAAISAAAQSDAEFWAMRMSPTDPDHPEGMIVGPVFTPPTSASDMDLAQFMARATPDDASQVEDAAPIPALAGYVSGGAAETNRQPAVLDPAPAPRIGARSAPLFPTPDNLAADAADPSDVFAQMMRGMDRYDAFRAQDETEDS
ncbi:MAG: hypothetical protein AAF360_19320, partial [Pseudomonadota bacterium]